MLDIASNLAQRVMPRPNACGPGPATAIMPAAKHFDPVIGIDIHFELVPPLLPIPNPFVGFLFDPFDYIPFIGATVWVNGLPRAQAGTAGVRMPAHQPMVGQFVKEPDNECEMLMGSMTVAVDSDAFSYMALPVLSCNDIGAAAPPRPKNPPVKARVLPTSIVIAIPMGPPVLVGGPPTVSLMALGMRAGVFMLGKGLSKLATLSKKAGRKVRAAASKAMGHEPRSKSPSTNRSCGRKGEPIDVVTGANVDAFVDFVQPGAPDLLWTRFYDSRLVDQPSIVGRGFRLNLQRELQRTDEGFTFVDGEGEPLDLPPLASHADVVSRDGYALRKIRGGIEGTQEGEVYEIEGPDGVMRFAPQHRDTPSPMVELRADGTTFSLVHDERDRLVEVRDAARRLRLHYDARGQLEQVVDPSGMEPSVLSWHRYDVDGRLIEHRDVHGHASTYAYDDAHRMTRKTDRNGYAFHYRYDDRGRCVHSWGDDGMYEVRLRYDDDARETTVTWPDGGCWRYRYDTDGVLVRIVDPYGGEQRLVRGDDGRVQQHIDEAGNATTLLYDQRGQHVAQRDCLGYLAPPLEVEPSPPNPLTYALPSTPLACRWGSTVPHPHRADPETRYDAWGRCREQRDAHGVQAWQHDAQGNPSAHRDHDRNISRLILGSWNQPRERVDAEAGRTRVETSFRGKITRVEDPGGVVHEYVYDRKDRLTELRRDGAPLDRYRWDAAGNLVEKLDGEGRTLLSLDHGPGNLLIGRALADGETQRFEHDARGRITRATTDALVVERRYDDQGRVVADLRDGAGVEHEQDGNRLVATRWFGRFEIRFEYEAEGSRTIVDPTGDRHRLEAGEDGTVTRRLANGTVEHQRFDDRGLCLRTELDGPGMETSWVRTHRYSGHGDLLDTLDSHAGPTTYAYDGLHRLLVARRDDGEAEHYRWDAAGNLLQQPGLRDVCVGRGNRLKRANREDLSYDHRLRLCRRDAAACSSEYRYDALDRLVELTRGGERWTAAYDPLTRRVSKTWRGQTTTYHWDDFRLGAEQFPDGTQRIYVYADLEAMVPLMFVEYVGRDAAASDGRVFHIFADQVGAPSCVQDEHGQVVWRARMNPFGRVQVDPASTVTMHLRFPGHLHDPETGLHLNRFRYYDPGLGRYLQSDPLGIVGGLNTYQYCPNPLSTVDMDGLVAIAFHHDGQVTVIDKGKVVTGPNGSPPPRPDLIRIEALSQKRIMDGITDKANKEGLAKPPTSGACYRWTFKWSACSTTGGRFKAEPNIEKLYGKHLAYRRETLAVTDIPGKLKKLHDDDAQFAAYVDLDRVQTLQYTRKWGNKFTDADGKKLSLTNVEQTNNPGWEQVAAHPQSDTMMVFYGRNSANESIWGHVVAYSPHGGPNGEPCLMDSNYGVFTFSDPANPGPSIEQYIKDIYTSDTMTIDHYTTLTLT